VVLENALVRAAAVTALAKFGVGQSDPEVKASVSVLLTRCLDDIDDEVRDRAALNLRLMSEEDEIANRFVKNGKLFLSFFLLFLDYANIGKRLHILAVHI
jgi:coatomer protein complex subunit gamma